MSVTPVAEVAATQALTVACSAVGTHWSKDFPICVERGVWGSKSSTAERMRHTDVFARIQPGQLGIAVHGFSWQDPENPPRNASGSAYGPRVQLEQFLQAQFSEFVLFEVEGLPYSSHAKIWSESEPDEWDLRVPINVYAHAKDVALRMDEINPLVAEAVRMSGIFASMPCVIAPATFGPQPSVEATVAAKRIAPTDALALVVQRTESSQARRTLLAGRRTAPCSFCSIDCLADDLHAVHLKARRVCSEQERLDPGVVVLACVACHHGFDSGALFVDAEGVIRTTEAARESAWRRAWLASLDGLSFAGHGPANVRDLTWHRLEVAGQRPSGDA
jgi:hypothetical protein